LEIETNFPNYLTKAMLRPFGKLLESIQSRDADARPRLSQFEARKLLR